MIENVAIVGGTHGNELTGVHLLQFWQRHPEHVARPSFKTQLILANPPAIAAKKRFIDKDLNRCFSAKNLESSDCSSWEEVRARELYQLLGPRGRDARCDFLIDLHSSTSQCGVMIILVNLSDFNLRLAAYLQQKIPTAHVVHFPVDAGDSPYMGSVCDRALGIEVGPVAQNLLRHDMCELSEQMLQHALDFAHKTNGGIQPFLPPTLQLFRFHSMLKFPVLGGAIAAAVHRDLQGQDYQPLHKGQPVFYNFDNSSAVTYEGEPGLCPVFINEAAYYADGVAMCLTERVSVKLPSEAH